MSESVPTTSGPQQRGPIFWLLAIGCLGALIAAGLMLRLLGEEHEDAEASTVAAVAALTAEPTATPPPTPTTTPSPTPSATGTTTPTPTPTDTPTATPSATPAAAAVTEAGEPSEPRPPPPPSPAETTSEPTEEPTPTESAAATSTTTATAEPEEPPSVQGDGGAESYSYGEVDRIRQGADVQPLSSNESLAAVARSWSDSMRSSGSLTHSPNVAGQIPRGHSRWAENIAHASTIAEAMRLLEGSSLHYQNMTYADFTDIGIGVVVDDDGWVWITQVFAQY